MKSCMPKGERDPHHHMQENKDASPILKKSK